MVWISNKSHHHLDRKYYAKVFMQKYVCSSLLCLLSFISKPASILSDKRWGTLESHCKTFLSKGTSCWIRMVESNFEVRTCRMRGLYSGSPQVSRWSFSTSAHWYSAVLTSHVCKESLCSCENQNTEIRSRQCRKWIQSFSRLPLLLAFNKEKQ